MQDPQQFVLVGGESCQQAIQGDEASALAEDAMKAQPQGAAAFCGGRQAIFFQIGIEAPDQSADTLLGGAVLVGEGIELVDQPFGMHPTQRMQATNVELAGIVAQHDRVAQEFMRVDAAPNAVLANFGPPPSFNLRLPRHDRGALHGLESQSGIV